MGSILGYQPPPLPPARPPGGWFTASELRMVFDDADELLVGGAQVTIDGVRFYKVSERRYKIMGE